MIYHKNSRSYNELIDKYHFTKKNKTIIFNERGSIEVLNKITNYYF